MMAAQDKRETLRQELLELNSKRNKIESELLTWQDVLSTQKVGMSDSLVDAEGFPRSDVDVYQVRTARNKVVTLQNDARTLMSQIETKLHEFHALNSTDAAPSR